MTFTQGKSTKDKPPCRISRQGWTRAAYGDHEKARTVVSPAERIIWITLQDFDVESLT